MNFKKWFSIVSGQEYPYITVYEQDREESLSHAWDTCKREVIKKIDTKILEAEIEDNEHSFSAAVVLKILKKEIEKL